MRRGRRYWNKVLHLLPISTDWIEKVTNYNVAIFDSRFLQCPVGDVSVRLDRLVPDIAMTDFEGSKVNFNDIEIGRQLGKGSFGVIYLGKFRGEVVAVKRYVIITTTIIIRHHHHHSPSAAICMTHIVHHSD
jgi:hypothetical protein